MRDHASVGGKRGGFTLVELLVVIAIVAVLIAIIFPTMQRARIQSNRIACASKMRQIAFGFRMYAEENKGWYPDLWRSFDAPRGIAEGVIADLLRNRSSAGVFLCSEDPEK